MFVSPHIFYKNIRLFGSLYFWIIVDDNRNFRKNWRETIRSPFFLNPTTTKSNSFNIPYFYMILTDVGSFSITFTKHSSVLSGLPVHPSNEPIVESSHCEHGWSMLLEESTEAFSCDMSLSFAEGVGKRNLKTKQLIFFIRIYEILKTATHKNWKNSYFSRHKHGTTFNENF